MEKGYFSIVLHAHIPFVRHRDNERLEERWLFEAISETYIPLLWNLENQQTEKVMTISFSPPLMEMLADSLLQRRFLHNIEKTQSLLNQEANRAQSAEEMKLVDFYKQRIERIKHTFLKYEQNPLKGFRKYMEEGKLVCICSSATHAFLPYLKTKEGVRAQISYGISTFTKHFGLKPKGFWLPECAYTPGIDRILFEEGIRYSFVDEHALKFADPKPSQGIGAPIYSPYGVILFPRNSKLSNQVWSSVDGYPGDFNYREFYRDIAYDRDWEYIKPYMHSEGIRYDTGLKYHRITGSTEDKQLYCRETALKMAKEHSTHFIKRIIAELQLNEQLSPPHLITTPFDAELFGHWWFEGPDWLNQVISDSDSSDELCFITPEQYIERHYHEFETVRVSFSTWGRHGYGEVWLNEKNSWIYAKLHQIEQDLIELVTVYKGKSLVIDRCLKQMVREWLLATSSDWPFILDDETVTEYANNRLNEHMKRFGQLRDLLVNDQLKDDILTEFEVEYPFMADVILDVLTSREDGPIINVIKEDKIKKPKKSILVLAWEYPPRVVGGLARHVFDLTKALVKEGCEVHVITTAVTGSSMYEIMNGVHVHRVTSLQPLANDFYLWVGSLNIAFSDYVVELAKKITFDLIHAHDWLVCAAAISIKEHLELPIVATIHATEHGRNNGIYTELQQKISHKEWQLTYEATKVIVCSEFMKDEVRKVFQLPPEKIVVIPNGVDFEMVVGEKTDWKRAYGAETDLFIFSVGRMVKEKGFQTIIDAAPAIIAKHPVKFIIAGKGPLLDQYQSQVIEKGLQEYVYFIGFVNDQLRNVILNGCDICLFPSYYEPFGIVALEAMIARKPTIVSDTGGLTEIVTHNKTGLTIYPNDVQSLVDQVIYCIENKNFANEIAQNGQELAKTKYNWDYIAKETNAIYREVYVSR
jgi:1,4-alpha-glucan branching enzyme